MHLLLLPNLLPQLPKVQFKDLLFLKALPLQAQFKDLLKALPRRAQCKDLLLRKTRFKDLHFLKDQLLSKILPIPKV